MTHAQAVQKHAAERYLLDEMPELERFAFEEHLFACQICAEDVRTGAVMQEGVRAGLLPARVEAAPETASGTGLEAAVAAAPVAAAQKVDVKPGPTIVPWAVAAMLALAAGYQTLWVIPGLREQIMGPSVLSPVTLRGASRGAEPTLTRPAAGAISLAVDLTGVTAGTRLTYDLRAPGDVPVASGTAAAPPPGTPLLLLIPASALESAGGYVLSVGTGGDGGPASVDYRFTITNP